MHSVILEKVLYYGAVFAQNRNSPLHIGSVKTNIGHLEGASNLAGIIKTTIALENRKIPPNMRLNNPNPNIGFEKWKIAVPTMPFSILPTR